MPTPQPKSPLAVHRFSAGMTQAQLAERAGISRTAVANIERGAEPSLGFDGRVSEWRQLALAIRDAVVARPGLTEVAEWKLEQHV